MTDTTSLRERLRSEVMRAAMKDNFVLSRDDVIELLGGMSAILSARAEPQAGEWVLVPKDLRESCLMYEAGVRAKNQFGTVAAIWHAMIAAAPTPPATAGKE